MRKREKEEIILFVSSMFRAHEEIEDAIEKNNLVLAQVMIQQCQDYGIQLGNIIEEKMGSGFVTVSYIEQYCESLFYIYTELNKEDYNQHKIKKILRNKLIKIENSVKNDIVVRKEIVFFPYKAAMWDSLESAYFWMKDQQNCDVRCVPIPYYDLKADGSFGEMHYEGLKYPKNVEIIDWKNYCFEEIKPEMIFIHNAYDNMNCVTSIHPRFYSKNLKKYTEELIYIPYFVLKEISPDNQIAIDDIKHFCFLPGIIYADKVIVQSENIRKIYINEFLRRAKECGLSDKYTEKPYLEQKILGLGSPKIERIKKTRKEDLEIPAEWLKIIEKPDGSKKKIIFYNISISALLKDSEAMLTKKIPCTFADLKERRNEIALLWRPHPLFRSTIVAMRPNLKEVYEKILEDYLKEGWGIYDDSADVDRAVILSDLYYGNESSVVRLYETTCKPILIQESELGSIKSTCTIGKRIFGLNDMGNSVYCLTFMQNEMINKWKYKVCDMDYAYEKIVAYEDRIIMIPRKSNAVVILNPQNITMDRINLPVEGEFVTCYYWRNVLYLFPCIGQAIVAVDLRNSDSHCYILPDELVRGDREGVFSYDIARIGDCFFLMIYGTNQILEFNSVNEQFKVHRLSEQYLINCLCENDNQIWIVTNGGMISEWKYDINEVNDLYNLTNSDSLFCISVFVRELNEIWLPSIQEGKIVIYNIQNNQIVEIDLRDEGMFIWMIEKHGQWVWVFLNKVDAIICIDIFSKKICRLRII